MVDAKRVDGRADLWSAGLLLYESLARSHPWGSTTTGPRVVTAILNEPLRPLRVMRPDVPRELDAIVGRLLDKDPMRRFATARDVAKALAPLAPIRSRMVLEEILRTAKPTGTAAPGGGATSPQATTARTGKSRGSPGKRIFLFILVFVVALAAAAAVLYFFFPGQLRPLLLR
jgi:serine/threonine-protein kinase